MSLLPAAGGWRRNGITVGDGPLREDEDVLWLQVGDAYADMRLGGERPWAFAGTTTVSRPRVTWTHLADTRPDRVEDTGELVVVPGGFTETGTFGDSTPYREEWLSIRPVTPARAAVYGQARVVRLGDCALWVTPTGAARLALGPAGWTRYAIVDIEPEGVATLLNSGAGCPAAYLGAWSAESNGQSASSHTRTAACKSLSS